MGYRRGYLRDIARLTFSYWDWGERLVALVLVIVSALGYIGLWLDWWDPEDGLFLIGGLASVGLFVWLVVLFVWLVPARRWHEHDQEQHPLASIEFGMDTAEKNRTALVYLELHNAPSGGYRATGRSLNGETRPVWPITFGLESTERFEGIYPDVLRLNIAKVDWNDSTIRFIYPGKKDGIDPPEYRLHDPHGFAGNRCDVGLRLSSTAFGMGYYDVTVSVWWDDTKGLLTGVDHRFQTEPITKQSGPDIPTRPIRTGG